MVTRMNVRCLFGFHRWKPSRFVRLGSTGATYVCHRCGKIEER